ncbi:MAG: ABC transporter ATP-binding protein [Verrucomicrobiota bacterium]
MKPRDRQLSFRMLRDLIAEFGWRYRAYLPTYILISAIYLLPPEFLRFFTEAATGLEELSASRFLSLLIIFGIGIAICLWVSVYLSSLLGEWLRLSLSMKLRHRVMNGLHRTSLETLDKAQRGDWLTRMTSDLRNVEFFVADSLPDQIHQLTILLGALTLFVMHTGPLGLVPLAFALLLAWGNASIQRRMAPSLGEAREREGQIFQFLIESFEGLRTIRSYRAESLIVERLNHGLRGLYTVSMRIIRRMGALMGVNELGSQIVITGCLSLLAWSLTKGTLTATEVLVYPFYLTLFLNAAKSLVASAYDWNRFFVEGGRLAQICYEIENSPTDEEPEVSGHLEIHDLTLGYPDQPPLIRDLELTLRPAEIVALVGPSGCGKSTLLEVVAGLRSTPNAKISSEGRQLDAIPLSFGAFVEQRPYIFAGSFRENLAFGLSIGEDHLWKALENVRLADLVRSRGGLDASLDDRGQNLSEGQRYRIALARAFLTKRPYLLLDEPFAALDQDSVSSVIAALHAERDRGAGVLLVTHQLPEKLDVTQIISFPSQTTEPSDDQKDSP